MEEFHRAQWKFYKDRGFKIGVGRISQPVAHLNEDREINDFYNIDQLIARYKGREEKYIRHETLPELSLEFFIDFYKNTSEDNKKILLKDYSNFSGVRIKDSYTILCDSLCNSPQEKIFFLKKLPFTVFEAKYIELHEFDKQLENLGLKDNALHRFYVDFFKPRKNQIKVPSTGVKVKSFLKAKYEEDKLEAFFPFFPFLQADYKEVDLDIFNNQHEFNTTTFVKLKAVVQKYGIKNWKTDDYKTHLSNLSNGIKEYYKLQSFKNEEDSFSKVLKIEFLHSNSQFNISLLNNLISEYFVSLKSNPQNPTFNKEVGLTWVLQYNLSKNLEIKNEKNKLLKI